MQRVNQGTCDFRSVMEDRRSVIILGRLIILGMDEQSSRNWQKVGDEGSVSDMIRSERGLGTFSQYFLVKFNR